MDITAKGKGSLKRRIKANAPLAIAPLLTLSPSQPFQGSACILREVSVHIKPEMNEDPVQGSLLYAALPVILGDMVLSVVLWGEKR